MVLCKKILLGTIDPYGLASYLSETSHCHLELMIVPDWSRLQIPAGAKVPKTSDCVSIVRDLLLSDSPSLISISLNSRKLSADFIDRIQFRQLPILEPDSSEACGNFEPR